MGLKVGLEFGLQLEVAGELPSGVGQLGLALLAAALASAGFALAGYAPMRSLLAAALAGASGWGPTSC